MFTQPERRTTLRQLHHQMALMRQQRNHQTHAVISRNLTFKALIIITINYNLICNYRGLWSCLVTGTDRDAIALFYNMLRGILLGICFVPIIMINNLKKTYHDISRAVMSQKRYILHIETHK